MQFYKERNFSFLISDTFSFFKNYGKNYFKNYFVLNSVLLLITTLVFIIGYREIFLQLMTSGSGGDSFFFESYFNENWALLSVTTILLFILFLALCLVMYTFPVFYMKRAAEGQTQIKADEILSDIKKNIGKFIIYLLGLTFILLPLFIVAMVISSFLMIIIIGFFLMILLMPAFINIMSMTLYDYLNSNRGFFGALSYSMRTQLGNMFDTRKAKFWKYWGSTIIMYIIIYAISMVFTMIPYFILMFGLFTNPNLDNNIDSDSFSGSMGVLLFVIYGISILLSSILYNLLAVNAGLMYYDSRSDLHRNVELSEIDTIGND
ncbi:DUF4013 domain-containing protein [Chryseobacterium sp. T1]